MSPRPLKTTLRRALGASFVLCALHASRAAAQTVSDAQAFMDRAESRLAVLSEDASRAAWVAATYITDDTEILSAQAQTKLAIAVQELATEGQKYEKLDLPPELRRKFMLLKLSLAAPPPADSAKAAELTRIQTSIEGAYGKGTYCRDSAGAPDDSVYRAAATDSAGRLCFQLGALEQIMAHSRDKRALDDAWAGWRTVSPPMKDKYARFVELSNEGARQLGFADAGAMWRAGYDMPPDQFAQEVERLWKQVEPLYRSLHTYVRNRLAATYGKAAMPDNGMIPADLLGNTWAQEWGNIYDVVAPAGATGGAVDVTRLLQDKHVDARGMVKYAEGFFTSLGFDPLPPTFWTRSMFTKPRDRDVVCHASAWDIDAEQDVRVKVCLEPTADDFVTIHHELGHNFYQRAYSGQPFLFRNGANDGFHEAIGDAIALSITPTYLQQVKLLGAAPSAAGDTLQLLRQALDKVAFLPFGLLVDQWRWKVFSGEIKPDDYNSAWWALREKYQGVTAPVTRAPSDFDPGAKYHVPANTPYTRYFLARILQFQFYRALCREAGFTGPLYRCSFYGSKAAGAKFAKMLEMGQSRPWPEILQAMTGEKEMDAGAMAEYFQPLKVWLDRENARR